MIELKSQKTRRSPEQLIKHLKEFNLRSEVLSRSVVLQSVRWPVPRSLCREHADREAA